MSFLGMLENVAKGVATGVAVVTVLPVLGAAGTITAAGVVVGSVLGGTAAVLDSLDDD